MIQLFHIHVTLLAISASFSDGFVPHSSFSKNCHARIPTQLLYEAVEGNDHDKAEQSMVPSKPQITSLNSAAELNQFLKVDKRLCAIKIHASWCKSCKLFGKQYERIGREIGDLVDINNNSTITRKGEIRLAEIEYGKNAELCKSLEVKKVPSIFFYYDRKQLDGFPCGPKKIAHTLERLDFFRSLSPAELEFEAGMRQGHVLGDELLEQILSSKQVSDKEQGTSHHQAEQSNNPN